MMMMMSHADSYRDHDVNENEEGGEGHVTERSLDDLLAMIVRSPRARRRLNQLVDRAGGLEALALAEAFEIIAHLEGRDPDMDEKPRRRARSSEIAATTTTKTKRAPYRGYRESAEALAASFELGRRAAIARTRIPKKLTSPDDVAAWAAPRLATLSHEELWVLALDGRGHLRAARCVARGGLHGASVRGPDPIRVALRLDATAFVLVHNHPSGDPTPSKEDVSLTANIAAASHVAGVPLIDHVVVSRGGHRCVPFPRRELDLGGGAPMESVASTSPGMRADLPRAQLPRLSALLRGNESLARGVDDG